MSAKATEVLESEGVNRIPSPNATRWNSTFLMISANIVNIESHTSGLLTRVADTIGSSVQLSERDTYSNVEGAMFTARTIQECNCATGS